MFELGQKLKNCVLCFKEGEFDYNSGANPDKVKSHIDFTLPPDVYPRNIWYDLEEDKCFSEYQYTIPRNADKDQNFFLPEGKKYTDFLYKEYVEKIKQFYPFSEEGSANVLQYKNCDMILSKPEQYEKFRDKKIMIAAGGPSCSDVSWQNIDYDHLWTVNEFYKNKSFAEKEIDLLLFSSITDFKNEQLIETIQKNNCLITFPIITNFIHDEFNFNSIKHFTERFKNNISFNYTRYSSNLGVGHKLIILAIFLGASEIYSVGNDGHNSMDLKSKYLNKKDRHAFDGEKNPPNWYSRYGHRMQDRQFVIFWDYVKKLQKDFDFKIYNLGEGKDYNVSSSITKEHFPLTRDIHEAL
tara:strand:- start:102 stop:1163 length:1062 start_codon:yes stop_codon:yes gene_type:complete